MIQRCLPTTAPAGSDQPEQEAGRQAHIAHVSSACLAVDLPQQQASERPVVLEAAAEEEAKDTVVATPAAPNKELGQTCHALDASLPLTGEQGSLQARRGALTIERAIGSYLQEQRASGRSPKTMEWHQTALGLFQQYLGGERHLCLLCQITEAEVRGWLVFLGTTPSTKDTGRSACTIATYARSARAFCSWLVRNGHMEHTPFVKGTIPKEGKKVIRLLEPGEFECLLLAARVGGDNDAYGERAAARNRAILWVLLDTGMCVSELCRLRLSDVDREQSALRVQRTGGQERWLALSPNGWHQLLSYLERYRPKGGYMEENHLFLSEWCQPLTINGIAQVLDRLKQRAGIQRKAHESIGVARHLCSPVCAGGGRVGRAV